MRVTRLLAVPLLVLTLAGCPAPPPQTPPPTAPASPSATAPAAPSAAAPTATGAAWRHRPGLTWQWQLSGPLDLSVRADVFELDAFTATAAQVARLHAAGRRVICYVNAGAYEDFRPDARRFPAALIGRSNGWPGERWLDIRGWDMLRPILADRFRMCRDKGFDAVEADNVDGYANDTGFALRPADQLAFNRRVARLAHSFGLAAGLKNDLAQVAELEPEFDFAVNEECFRYRECARLAPFRRAGKAIFHVEYGLPAGDFCEQTRRLGLTSMAKRPELDAWRAPCPGPP